MKLKRVCIVMNAQAGTYLQCDEEELKATFQEICESHGSEMTLIASEPGDIEKNIQHALASENQYDALFLGGGDGTVTHSVPQLLKSEIPVGIIPLGTMNMVARDLGISLEPTEALKGLLEGSLEKIDVAEVNQTYFIDRVTLGFYPKVLNEWQETRGESSLSRIFFFMKYFIKRLFNNRRLKFRLTPKDVAEHTLKSKVIIISNNPYSTESLGPIPKRDSLSQGQMGVYVSRHKSFWSLLKLLFLGLSGKWQNDEQMEILQTRQIKIDLPTHKKLTTSLDGEVIQLQPPYQFQIHPKVLPLLVPSLHTA